MPAVARARIADSRPEPGPETRTSTERRPWSRAALAAPTAACCAANGVPLREPRKPSEPELFQRERVARLVGDGDDGVVERRLNEDEAKWNVLALALLELLVLAGLGAGCLVFCVFAMAYFVAFFLPATVPLRGPLRVRALVWVRWPRTGSERRWRRPR